MLSFEEKFEYKVIGYFFLDGDLPRKEANERLIAERIVGHIPNEIFKKKELRDIFVVIKEFYNNSNNHRIPTLTQFRQELHNKFSENENKFEIIKQHFEACLRAVSKEDKQYLRENLEKRVKKEIVKTNLDDVQKRL